jgi:predicted MFS family arabinose efflux permease
MARDGESRSLVVVAGSTLGTVFEWYDFFLYGSLASNIAAHFFSGVDETAGFIFALAGFAVGFLVRPLGALVFGRIGDRLGRKSTFIATLGIMGAATVLMGLVPGYATIGIAAPLLLVGLRVLQGLAIGGEFVGALTYVAEHAPADRRGLHGSFLPASAIAGFVLSLLVVAGVRAAVGAEAFAAWGWRVPFLLSAPLLAVSIWIRSRLHESPVFDRLKAAGTLSKAPLRDSFLRWSNLKYVLVALVATSGQAVVFYTASFYALYFLQRAARLETLAASLLLIPPLLLGFAMVLLAGWWSDKVGRKPLVMTGFALAALLFFPLYRGLLSTANPPLAHAQATAPVVLRADATKCSFQFDPLGRNTFDRSSCDIAAAYLAGAGISYRLEPGTGPAQVEIGSEVVEIPAPQVAGGTSSGQIAAFRERLKAVLAQKGYGANADGASMQPFRAMLVLVLLLAINALAGGPNITMLAELFPARIRYSSLALPQNVGNGWIGGLLPATAFAIVAATGNVFAGLWYPVVCVAVSFALCLLFLPETRGRSFD